MDVIWGFVIGVAIIVLGLLVGHWLRQKAVDRQEYEAWAEFERQRCLNSPYYFFITYWEVNGEKPNPRMSEQEFNDLFDKLSQEIITKQR